MKRFLWLVSIACLLIGSAMGQSGKTIPGVKADSVPVLDGDLTKAFWSKAAKANTFTDFVSGAVVQDQTEVVIEYDSDFIYIGFKCRDSQPELITARETVRDTKYLIDGAPNTEDNVEVEIDPFLTHSAADVSRFSVNAIGTRSAAIASGRGSKAEWKGDWDATVKRDATGWSCEMKISWASFHHPSVAGLSNLGINFSRYINRTKVLQEWSRTGPQGFLDQEGVWTGVEFPQDPFKRQLSILPFMLGGFTNGSGLSVKGGLDARYTLNPELTAVGTLFPDYSNIEGSIQSIAYSHAPHTIAETRPLFTEGAGNFSNAIPINDLGSYFYSPSIGQFDAGTKLYGKLAANDSVGLLDTLSFEGRNDFVGRYSHDFSATTSAGAMLVNKSDGGDSNTDAAIDVHRRLGKLQLDGVAGNSQGLGARGSEENLSFAYQDKQLTSLLQLSEAASSFLAPDGYFPFTNLKGVLEDEDYLWTWRNGFWRSAELTISPIDWVHLNGSPFYEGVVSSFSMLTKNDLQLSIQDSHDEFEGESDNYRTLQVTQGVTNRFQQMGLQFLTGIEGGAPISALGPSLSFRLLKKLDISYQGLIQNREGLTQQHILTANYEISPIRSVGGRLVTENGDTNLYLFFHNSGGKGTDYYILFGNPDAPRTVTAIQAKVIFSF